MAGRMKPIQHRIIDARNIPVEAPLAGYEAWIRHCFNPQNPAQADYQPRIVRPDGEKIAGAIVATQAAAQAEIDAYFTDLIDAAAAAADLDAEIAAYADELAQQATADVSANTPTNALAAARIAHLANTPATALQATLAIIFEHWQRAVLEGDEGRIALLAERGREVSGAWKARCQQEQPAAA